MLIIQGYSMNITPVKPDIVTVSMRHVPLVGFVSLITLLSVVYKLTSTMRKNIFGPTPDNFEARWYTH